MKDRIASTAPVLKAQLKKEELIQDRFQLHKALHTLIPASITYDDIVFLCIGTDRVTGDAYGPLVGTFLQNRGYQNVLGNLEDPIHAMNLQEVVASIPKNKKIIAIDACLGYYQQIGSFQVIDGPIQPGKGVGKDLGWVGDYSIMGRVNIGGYMEHLVLANTRLSIVMKMAETTTSALFRRFPKYKMN